VQLHLGSSEGAAFFTSLLLSCLCWPACFLIQPSLTLTSPSWLPCRSKGVHALVKLVDTGSTLEAVYLAEQVQCTGST
jgi:hypothetical protein